MLGRAGGVTLTHLDWHPNLALEKASAKAVRRLARELLRGRRVTVQALTWGLVLGFEVQPQLSAALAGGKRARERERRYSHLLMMRLANWGAATQSAASDALGELRAWVAETSAPYEGVQSMRSRAVWRTPGVWADGRAFTALIHAHDRSLIQYEPLRHGEMAAAVARGDQAAVQGQAALAVIRERWRKANEARLRLAFKVAAEELGVPPLLEHDDLSKGEKPLPRAVILYCAMLRNACQKRRAAGGSSTKSERICQEVRETEAAYIEDLHTVITVYMRPALERKLLSDADARAIFANLDDLVRCATALHEQMLNEGDPVAVLAAAFLHVAPFFRLYTHYCTQYEHALGTLHRCRKRTPALDEFLSRQARHADAAVVAVCCRVNI